MQGQKKKKKSILQPYTGPAESDVLTQDVSEEGVQDSAILTNIIHDSQANRSLRTPDKEHH